LGIVVHRGVFVLDVCFLGECEEDDEERREMDDIGVRFISMACQIPVYSSILTKLTFQGMYSICDIQAYLTRKRLRYCNRKRYSAH
jgi:hypothetical protein